MKKDDLTQHHERTQELIHKIESKDRRFRTAQSVFMIALMITLIAVIAIQFRTLETVKQQLAVQKATTAETTKQSDQQRKIIIRRLDCMVAFFSQKDRTNLSIQDIDKCSINRDGDINQFFAPANGTSSSTSTNGDGSKTTTTTTNSTPGNPGANSQTPPAQPVPQPPVVEPRPPAQVLGVPVCVPFTNVCVRS
jgi:hypothetical protein